MRGLSILVLSLACLAVVPGAWADKDKNKGHGHGHGHGHGKAPEMAAAPGRFVVSERDRTTV